MERIAPEVMGVATECLVCDPDYFRYSFYHLTADRGQTWQAWQSNGTERFVNASTGWRLFTPEEGRPTQLLQTTDGGVTWAKINTLPWRGSLHFVSEQVGWATARRGSAVSLLHTSDGGRTWTQIEPKITTP